MSIRLLAMSIFEPGGKVIQLPVLSDNGGMVVMMPLCEIPPLSVLRKPLDEPPAPFIAMSEPLPTEYDS